MEISKSQLKNAPDFTGETGTFEVSAHLRRNMEKNCWSHYVELLSISDYMARSFYEKQCLSDTWSVRELKRQRDTSLFERIALSWDKNQIAALSQEGQKKNKSCSKQKAFRTFGCCG